MMARKLRIRKSFLDVLSAYNYDTDSYEFQYVYSRRNGSSFRNIIKHNKPKTFEDLYKMVKRCSDIGPAFTLEKQIIMYGQQEGLARFNKRRSKYGITYDKMIERYGIEEGTKRWDEYRSKQAISNTYEYKKDKYGMSKDEFDEYNKSRASTLDNFVKRHGIEEGTKRWDEYCARQAYTNSEEYLGTEKYTQVNKLKAHTLDGYIEKYGQDAGEQKFIEYNKQWSQSIANYSNISQELFTGLLDYDIISDRKCYFATLAGEYGLLCDDGRYRLYDFVCPELRLVIEYHGDHYHGNPKMYNPNDVLLGKGQAETLVKNKWIEDEYKQNQIRKHRGFDTIIVWDSEYRKDKEEVIGRIIDYVINRI
jgi:hypothetical protein